MKLKKLQQRIKAATTFKSVAERLLEGKAKRVTPEYLRRIESGLRSNLYPVIGDLPIQEITPPLLRESLKKIESRGSLDMLGNVRRWSAEVFDFAKAHGQFTGDNPAEALLKNIFKPHQTTHMVGLAWNEVPKFMQRLDEMHAEGATIAAVKLLFLTACRPGEVRKGRWEEIDWENARWTIPGERMKMRRVRPQPHAVPLSRQAIEVLKVLKELTGHSEYLFPSRIGAKKSACLTDIAILKAVKRASGNPKIHAHGLRSTFSTHVGESLLWPDAVKEAALAHGKRGVEGIYDRATHYVERTKLMQWWADEIDAARNITFSPDANM
jgi:integrase